MRNYHLLTFIICLTVNSFGQTTFNHRFSFGYYGATLCSIVPTDSCYYATGIIVDTVFPYQTGSVFVKFNLEGMPEYHKTLTNPSRSYETWAYTLTPTQDTAFVVTGYSYTPEMKALLIKYNKFGDTLFTKEYLNPYYPQLDFIRPNDLEVQIDGSFWMLSWITANNQSNGNILLSRLNINGELIWAKEYGDAIRNDVPTSLKKTYDGKIIIGSAVWNNNLVVENYQFRSHIFQVDSSGDIEWQYISPISEGLHGMSADMELTESGSLIIGTSLGEEIPLASVNDVYFEKMIFELKPSHDLEWKRIFDGDFPAYWTTITNIEKISDDSGFIIAGTTARDNNPNDFDSKELGWIGKISHNGDSIWTREYEGITSASSSQLIFDLKETPDGGFVLCGESLDWLADSIPQQAWLLKLDQHGCLVPGCHIIGTASETQPEIKLEIYPNPTTDYLNFYLRTPKALKSADFRIVSAEGKVMKTFSSDNPDATFMLPVWDWAAGVYFLQYLEEGVVVCSEQFVKQ
jgi:hypothetical protein